MALLFKPHNEHYKWVLLAAHKFCTLTHAHTIHTYTSLYLALFPVLHHSYHRLQYFSVLFVLQAMIAVAEDGEQGYTIHTRLCHLHHTHFPCSWFCHVDDDIYINLKVLVQTLAKFYPRKEPIYFGRSGSSWRRPRQVKRLAKLGKPGQRYHFAVGGMYCLSRAMLERAKPYLVWVLPYVAYRKGFQDWSCTKVVQSIAICITVQLGWYLYVVYRGSEAFGNSCTRTMEPEDVTVGIIIGTSFVCFMSYQSRTLGHKRWLCH